MIQPHRTSENQRPRHIKSNASRRTNDGFQITKNSPELSRERQRRRLESQRRPAGPPKRP